MPDATTPRPLDSFGVAGTIVCCALWGGNAVAVKYAVPDLPPVGCAAVRFAIALPIVAVVCWRIGHALQVGRLSGKIGKEVVVKMNVDPKTGKVKYTSAHDLRRSPLSSDAVHIQRSAPPHSIICSLPRSA